ncbi:MAG: hypothetical protein Q9163_002102 [Psora crenata]
MDNLERRRGASNTVPAAEPTKQEVEDVHDPDEYGLDDLDDMLDEFSAAKIHEPILPAQKPPTTPPSYHNNDAAFDMAADGFSKQLQDQMAAFMGGMDETPEMRQEIEKMAKDLGVGVDPEPPSKSKAQATQVSNIPVSSPVSEEPFQETIRKTMERMQASGEQGGDAVQTAESDEILAQMLKDMQDNGLGAEAGEEGFDKMLLGMMEQLTNKEILYEPMKELHDKYPGWLQNNRANSKPEDLSRYELQQRLVSEIVTRFEQEDYSDTKPADREFIVNRMQQMQAAGSPPAALVGDMSAAQEVLDTGDPGCIQQ